MSSEIAPDKWAITDEDWSTALGLPRRPEGWGLVMFEDGDRRWTWAGDRVVVAALGEHKGGVPNWDTTFTLEADGWPEPIPSSRGPRSMSWRPRHTSD